MKRLLIILVIFFALTGGMIFFSPYRANNVYPHKALIETIVINASKDTVYRYLGNSANASRWSTFVDHISTLNGTDVKDGEIGSVRRCFCDADEKGMQWDEEILVNEEGKRRQLSIFNFKDFLLYADGLRTEQLYEELDPTHCRLSFTLFFKNGECSFVDEIKMHFASYRASGIFQKNLENIRKENERSAEQ